MSLNCENFNNIKKKSTFSDQSHQMTKHLEDVLIMVVQFFMESRNTNFKEIKKINWKVCYYYVLK